jgi:hypothetical protein
MVFLRRLLMLLRNSNLQHTRNEVKKIIHVHLLDCGHITNKFSDEKISVRLSSEGEGLVMRPGLLFT